GIDEPGDLAKLLGAITLLCKAIQQAAAGVRPAPEPAQFGLILEEVGDVAEHALHEFGGRHRLAIGAPEAGGHHVLDLSGLAIRELDLHPFRAFARRLAALGAEFRRRLLADARALATIRADARRGLLADARLLAAFRAGVFDDLLGRPVPL